MRFSAGVHVLLSDYMRNVVIIGRKSTCVTVLANNHSVIITTHLPAARSRRSNISIEVGSTPAPAAQLPCPSCIPRTAGSTH